jgi:23S rRNA maturation mini-RNase III
MSERHPLKDSEVDAQANAVERVTVYSVVEEEEVVVVKQVRNEQHSSKDRQVDVQAKVVEQAIV